jgi:hypothetical protein
LQSEIVLSLPDAMMALGYIEHPALTGLKAAAILDVARL